MADGSYKAVPKCAPIARSILACFSRGVEQVYCVRRGVYTALEYGRAYAKVADVGAHTRVMLPDGKLRKYPSWTFSPEPPPRLLRWKLDDRIDDPLCDWIDVSFDLEGTVRWLAFVTPTYLARQLPRSGEPCWAQENMVVVMEITESVVSECLQHLLEQGDLATHGRLLETNPSDWFEPAGVIEPSDE